MSKKAFAMLLFVLLVVCFVFWALLPRDVDSKAQNMERESLVLDALSPEGVTQDELYALSFPPLKKGSDAYELVAGMAESMCNDPEFREASEFKKLIRIFEPLWEYNLKSLETRENYLPQHGNQSWRTWATVAGAGVMYEFILEEEMRGVASSKEIEEFRKHFELKESPPYVFDQMLKEMKDIIACPEELKNGINTDFKGDFTG